MDYLTSEAEQQQTATKVFLALNDGGVQAAFGHWTVDEFRPQQGSVGFVAQLRCKELDVDLWEEIVISPETVLHLDGYDEWDPHSIFEMVQNETLAAMTRISMQVKALYPEVALVSVRSVNETWMTVLGRSLASCTRNSLKKMTRKET